MQSPGNDFLYVGIKDGTIRAFVVDDPKYPKDSAKLVAEWIRMGRTVERMDRKVALARIKAERVANGESANGGERA
jgi:hypothetical protein